VATPSSRPAWFGEFLADRGTRKPSPHTLAAYRRDFDQIAAIITGQPDVSGLASTSVTYRGDHLSSSSQIWA